MGLKENITAMLEEGVASYHTPGHHGNLLSPLGEIGAYDLTELEETGSLYEGSELFLEIEKEYEDFYHSGGSVLSAGGCTLAIQGMLTLFCRPGDRVIFSRTAHRSGVSVAGLLDLSVEWLYPDEYRGEGLAGTTSVKALETLLEEKPDVKAVVVTSPDYFGCSVDISGYSKVCQKAGVPLLVDNAHGSHFIFFDRHPLTLGATATADSLHKTLPVMTGGAILHLRDTGLKERVRRLLPLYGSTSPSYPILLSLEQCGRRLEELKDLYQGFALEVLELKAYAERLGLLCCWGDDPLRVVLCHGGGLEEVTALVKKLKISPELISDSHLILLCSPFGRLDLLYRLCDAFAGVAEGSKKGGAPVPRGKKAMSIRQALFSPSVSISVEEAEGRIAAEVIAPCPPGIPLTIPGEIIPADINFLLKRYSLNQIFVVE